MTNTPQSPWLFSELWSSSWSSWFMEKESSLNTNVKPRRLASLDCINLEVVIFFFKFQDQKPFHVEYRLLGNIRECMEPDAICFLSTKTSDIIIHMWITIETVNILLFLFVGWFVWGGGLPLWPWLVLNSQEIHLLASTSSEGLRVRIAPPYLTTVSISLEVGFLYDDLELANTSEDDWLSYLRWDQGRSEWCGYMSIYQRGENWGSEEWEIRPFHY